ncbi:MAG: TetR/AcrR family transcriptional regulator [Acidimicrobiaceae bacterium]|nr:TetR/AcrR family transcriptional regulator [Acidimicrobiaceae bacterium]
MVGISDSQRQATHAMLIDAFGDLMHEVGVEGTTVTAVAARVGVARSAFYNYFDDIPALLHAYVEREMETFANNRRAELEAISDPTERLEAFIAGSLHGFRHHASPLDLAPAVGFNHQIHVEEQLEPVRELVGDIMAAGVEQGAFRSDAASPVVVEMLLHALNSQRLPIATGTTDPADVTPTMTTTLIAAVRAG